MRGEKGDMVIISLVDENNLHCREMQRYNLLKMTIMPSISLMKVTWWWICRASAGSTCLSFSFFSGNLDRPSREYHSFATLYAKDSSNYLSYIVQYFFIFYFFRSKKS